MQKRKICIVTGTRAEYGLLTPLIGAVEADGSLELQLVVTGAHLAPEFGETNRAIEADGFPIAAKIEMLLSGNTPVGVTKSMGVELIGLADVLARLEPDIIVLLGDRYEILAAAAAALMFNIPIAHIHGGETTEGAVDEGIRHAVTKMAALHFASRQRHAERILQMGENPAHVYEVGAIGLDNIFNLKLLSLEELSRQLGFPLGEKFLLVTYHPVTARGKTDRAADPLSELMNALDKFPDYKVLITKANSDVGGREINERWDAFAAAEPSRVACRASLGQLRYLSALKYAAALVGNSSSGLIEAPIMHTPTVNLGDRQKGREREKSVIDCDETEAAIAKGISRALSPEFQARAQSVVVPHFDGQIARNIKNILRDIPLEGLCRKHFFESRRE